MMAAAADAASSTEIAGSRPRVLAVTVLTHLGDDDLGTLGIEGGSGNQVLRLARLARNSGLDGVVASAHEVTAIREATEDELEILVPGVRPQWAMAAHDQKRVATPAEVARAGASYVVVGRAITAQANRREAASRILEELTTTAM